MIGGAPCGKNDDDLKVDGESLEDEVEVMEEDPKGTRGRRSSLRCRGRCT